MAEEIPAAVYGGNYWWRSPRTAGNYSSCSPDILDMENFGPLWPKDLMDKKQKSSDESSDDSLVFQDIQKPGSHTTTMSPDSAFQLTATVLSDSSETAATDWIQNLLFRVQDDGMNSFSNNGDDGLKAEIEADHQVITVDQQRSLSLATDSNGGTTFPISSTSYGYNPSCLLEYLHSSNSQPLQQPLYDFHLTNEKESFPNVTIEHNRHEIWDLGSLTKEGPGELPFKRPRLETPSPLPIFKVRKEKLGDRITALQQLVSPFGKTDTASVLHEAIEYIKLLHDQVNILSASYMKGPTKQLQPNHDKGHKQGLRSLGLCLVPVSTSFPVATGFWTPSYEGSFK